MKSIWKSTFNFMLLDLVDLLRLKKSASHQTSFSFPIGQRAIVQSENVYVLMDPPREITLMVKCSDNARVKLCSTVCDDSNTYTVKVFTETL